MNRSNLIALPHSFSLPLATTRNVFDPEDVVKKQAKLTREHESLKDTYSRMIERGPARFHVKPHGISSMGNLYAALPNFKEVLDDIRRTIALSEDSDDGLEITPMLLLGEPGIGKTHFAKKVADLLGTGMTLVPMSSVTAGWILSGSSSQWRGAKPGKIFEAIVEGEYANPVIVVDEIDKASYGAQYDPLGSLYNLLEYDTARNFTDEFAEVAVDASQAIWITTANDARSIPDPILNRMNVFEIEPPSQEEVRMIAQNLYKDICNDHNWGINFGPEILTKTLDRLTEMKPREIRRALMVGFGNARLNARYEIMPQDIEGVRTKKSTMGFIQ